MGFLLFEGNKIHEREMSSLSLSRSRARAINCRTFVGVEKYIYFPAPPKNSNLLSSHFPKKNRPPQIPFLVIQPKNICHKRREDLNYQTFKITASVFLLKPKYIIILFLKVEIFILCTWIVELSTKQVFSSKFYHRKWLPANGIVIQINKTCVVGIAC